MAQLTGFIERRKYDFCYMLFGVKAPARAKPNLRQGGAVQEGFIVMHKLISIYLICC